MNYVQRVEFLLNNHEIRLNGEIILSNIPQNFYKISPALD